MICPNCKAKISKNDDVCKACGLKLKLSHKPMDDWIATVTPKFQLLYELIPSLQEIFIFLLTLCVGTFATDKFQVPKIYTRYACAFLIVLFAIEICIRFLKNRKMRYHIYQNRIVFEYSFFRHGIYELLYENVMDIEYSQRLLEKMFGMGSIRIYADRSVCRGIVLYRIPNGKVLYRNMKKLIQEVK